MRTPVGLLLAVLAIGGAGMFSTVAATTPDRGPWFVGLGFGPSRGVIYPQGEGSGIWITGSSPQFRFGRFVSRRLALGFESQGWFTEVGTAGEGLPLQLKLRLGAHLWPLSGTIFLGPERGFWSGFFLSVGAGPAISNAAIAFPDPEDADGGKELQARLDEWGWGAFGTVGYEILLSRDFGVGLKLSSKHIQIDDEIIGRVWFGGLEMHLAWYF